MSRRIRVEVQFVFESEVDEDYASRDRDLEAKAIKHAWRILGEDAQSDVLVQDDIVHLDHASPRGRYKFITSHGLSDAPRVRRMR